MDAEPAGEPLWPGRIAAEGGCMLWRGEVVSGDERGTAMRRPSTPADGQRRTARRSHAVLDAEPAGEPLDHGRITAGGGDVQGIWWGGERRGWGGGGGGRISGRDRMGDEMRSRERRGRARV
jgi:hypothetical protein